MKVIFTIMNDNIEKEIQERVDFKMNEIITSLKNKAAYHFNSVMNGGNPKDSYKRDGINEAISIVEKERDLPTPTNNMYGEKYMKKRDKFVDDVFERLVPRGSMGGQKEINLRSYLANYFEETFNVI